MKTWKFSNEFATKKIEGLKKKIKDTKASKTMYNETFQEKEATLKLLMVQVESYSRLLKDL